MLRLPTRFVSFAVALWLCPRPAVAAASLELYGTLEAMGVIVTIDPADDPDQDATAAVEFRVGGLGAYRPGFPPERVALSRWVGSLFWLTADTDYDVRVTLADPDRGPIDGVILVATARTRAEPALPPPSASHVASPTGSGTICTTALPCALGVAVGRVRPGEEVVLRGGSYFVGGLSVASGTASAPVVIRSAAGEQAVLDGADPAPFTWTAAGGGVYSTTLNVAEPQVVADGVRLFPHATLGDLQARQWGLDGFFAIGTTLYVRLPGDADPVSAAMAISRENVAVTLGAGEGFVAFLDLTFRNYGQGSWSKAIYLNGGSDTLIRGCTFEHNDVGVGFKRAAARNLIERSRFTDTSFPWPWDAHKASGLIESTATVFFEPATGRGNIIRNNTVHGGFDGIGCAPETTGGDPTSETDVVGNEVFDLGDDGIVTDGASSNIRIWRNDIHDILAGISLAPSWIGPTYVFHNVIRRMDTGVNQWPGTPLKLNSVPSGSGPIFFLHNTVDVVTAGQNSIHIVPPGAWSRLVLRNNILLASQNVLRNGNPTEPTDFDYDCMSTTGPTFASWNGNHPTLADFRLQVGQELNGIEGNPVFVDPVAGDYHLQPGGGCIDGGVLLPGLNDDFSGSAPDMGAYELNECNSQPPIGNVGNSLRAVRSTGDVDLTWPGAMVTPPNHAVWSTPVPAEVVESPRGIGDETLLVVTAAMRWLDVGALPAPPTLLCYEVLAADGCDAPVFP